MTIDPDIMEQARETAAAYHNWSLGRTLNHSTAELAQRIAAAMQATRDAEREAAYETAAKWHDKNARLCLEASKDDPRLNVDDRRRAYEASRHHAASAASLRSIAIEKRRSILKQGAAA